MDKKYQLKVYVVGETDESRKLISNLREILSGELNGNYRLQVINLLENPSLAGEDKIFATPTVVKLLPAPTRKIIGDLSNREKVLVGLDLVGE